MMVEWCWASTVVTPVDFHLPTSSGVSFQSMEKKHRTVIWDAEIVYWLISWKVIGKSVHGWLRCQTLTCSEDFPSGMTMPITSASEISNLHNSPMLHFSGETLTTVKVYWNRDCFCENGTALFTVSENGVYSLKFSKAHLTQSKVYYSHNFIQ